MGYESPQEEGFFGNTLVLKENRLGSHGEKMSKSSEYCQRPSMGSAAARPVRRSDENKCINGKPIHHKLF